MSVIFRFYNLLFRVLFYILLLVSSQAAFSATLDLQRKQYQQAKVALRKGQIEKFHQLAGKLETYPLYPYLRYHYLIKRMPRIEATEITIFLQQYADFHLAENLRRIWLKYLIRRQQWATYLEHYIPQADKNLQCYQLQARIYTNNYAHLLEDIRTIWLHGKSLPPSCDRAFALLYKSNFMTNDLVWQRIQLAMENKNIGLVNYLRRYLDAEHQQWASRWISMHQKPSTGTKNINYTDVSIAREILLYGIQQLAKRNIKLAIGRWDKLQMHYSFTAEQRYTTNRTLAIGVAQKKQYTQAISLLDRLQPSLDDQEVLYWRLRAGLQNRDWQRLYHWLSNTPDDPDIRTRWIYWRGRALEKIGNIKEAHQNFAVIANERDYYGFLAADRINTEYRMNNMPIVVDSFSKIQVEDMPGVQRAKELYLTQGISHLFAKEWFYALKTMHQHQKKVAATIAANWQWHIGVISTIKSAQAFDALELRFPLPFFEEINKYTEARQLDSGWTYALTRSESAFMENAKSPAGALGLTQIMPKTGKATAKKIGMRGFRTKDLLVAEKNIIIGTAYMRQMQDKFAGNILLATAAYNAGPSRVRQWLPKKACVEADVWVELIPFKETRKYVRRVLFYANIYDWLLGRQVVPISKRMSHIISPNPIEGSANVCAIK